MNTAQRNAFIEFLWEEYRPRIEQQRAFIQERLDNDPPESRRPNTVRDYNARKAKLDALLAALPARQGGPQ